MPSRIFRWSSTTSTACFISVDDCNLHDPCGSERVATFLEQNREELSLSRRGTNVRLTRAEEVTPWALPDPHARAPRVGCVQLLDSIKAGALRHRQLHPDSSPAHPAAARKQLSRLFPRAVPVAVRARARAVRAGSAAADGARRQAYERARETSPSPCN